jgi:uncharacterized protein (TIGR02646 family)
MIGLDRNRERDGRLIHPGDAWSESAQSATADALRERVDHAVRDDIYAHLDARVALEALTDGKCAYCEVPLARFDWDVEHFRPKGRVKERPDHPGYYWLAYTWSNLLPSCTFCNQNRKERPTFDDPAPGETGGKLDQFPIEDEATRATDPEHDLISERPLLLDPAAENPAEHLGYHPTGGIFALAGSKKGETSIRVFRLNLRRLRAERGKTLRIVREAMEASERARQRGEEDAAAALVAIVGSLAADDMPFAGMVRFFIANPDALGIRPE